MRELEPLDKTAMDQDTRVVSSIPDPELPGNTYYFSIDGDHAILSESRYYIDPEGEWESEWLGSQLEFPKQGLPWFVDVIENRFLKDADEGGLPFGQYHVTENVGGERLKVQRCFGLNHRRETGFDLTTLDRRDRLKFPMSYSFTDVALFEKGLFDWFKGLAERIRRGEL